MQRYFVQYHSENEFERYDFDQKGDIRQVFTLKPVKQDVFGSNCFLIVGDESTPTQFQLASYFTIVNRAVDGEETIISGPVIKAFSRNEVPLNNVAGYKEFQKEMGNFLRGFTHITNSAFLNTLLHLVGEEPKDNGDSLWTDEEYKAAVTAYLEMRSEVLQNKKLVKKNYYTRLHEQFPHRTVKSFEFRMQNISFVFSLMGRDWIPGLRPARNISLPIVDKIESMIHKLEGSQNQKIAKFEASVESNLVEKEVPLPKGSYKPTTSTITTIVRERSSEVKSWVIKAANGKCECCDKPPPFMQENGRPYLEVHHVRRLADNGTDTVSNTVAVCPNCHRELHHGTNRKVLVESMYRKLPRLKRE